MAVIRASAYLTAGSTDGPLIMPQWDKQEKSSNLNFLIQKDVGMLIIDLHNSVQKFYLFFFWAFHFFCHVLLQTLWHLSASTRLLDTMLFLAVT